MIIVHISIYDTIFYMNTRHGILDTECIVFDYASVQPSHDQVLVQLAIRISALEAHLGTANEIVV